MPKNAASYLGVSIDSYTEAIFVKQNTMANAFNARNTKICYFSENIYLLNGTNWAVNFMFMFRSQNSTLGTPKVMMIKFTGTVHVS